MLGSFQVDMINPDNSGIINWLITMGIVYTLIVAQNTNGNANYQLYMLMDKLIDSENNIKFL